MREAGYELYGKDQEGEVYEGFLNLEEFSLDDAKEAADQVHRESRRGRFPYAYVVVRQATDRRKVLYKST